MRLGMMLFVASLLVVAPLVSPEFYAFAFKHGSSVGPHHRHHEVAEHVQRSDLTERGYSYTNIRATWYGAGLSACGATYSPSDFIVALSQETFGWSYPSPYCNREIIISYGGKTANAKIVDSCVACSLHSPWALDFTEGLFSYFADPGLGVIAVDWSFADGSGGGAPATTKHTKAYQPPSSTSHHSRTTHHTTSAALTTTSTHSAEPTTTTTLQHTTPTTTRTSHIWSRNATSTNTLPTSSVTPSTTDNLYNLNQLILNLENFLDAEARK